MRDAPLLNLVLALGLVLMVGWLLVIGQAIILPVVMAIIAVYVVTTAADALEDRLKGFRFGCHKFEVRSEPLPYHRIPDDGLGPAAPSPFPPPRKLPNAPRQLKKKRDGLS